MVYHGLFGMGFEAGGIRFSPVVPQNFQHLSLSGVKYRDCMLKISIQGNGTHVDAFQLDGQPRAVPFLDAALAGNHAIEIRLGSTGH